MSDDIVTILSNQLPLLAKSAVSLPVAAVLSAALAFRPRRRGMPKRELEVIHSQVLLGIVGALIMLIVGESLARAFGIVGAAGLVRYRARIEDPEDAGVMLSTLGLGLAAGVGLYLLAVFATLFLFVVLWFVEQHPPKVQISYRLKVSTSEPLKLQPKIETVLRNHRLKYELRDRSDDELDYDLQIASDQPTDKVSSALQQLETESRLSFTWKLKMSE